MRATLPLLVLLWGCSAVVEPVKQAIFGEQGDARAASQGASTPGSASASTAPAASLASLAAGEVGVVHIPVEGVGDVAVRIAVPEQARYPEGAPVVVLVPPYFTPVQGFTATPEAQQLGFVSLSPLWPGRGDRRSGVKSEGTDDFGGPVHRAALAAVALYGAGQLKDVDGGTLADRVGLTVQGDNLGLYAFSHPGMAATRTLSEHAAELDGVVDWMIGHENPTNDVLSAVELGYWGDDKRPVHNEQYEGFEDGTCKVDYSQVSWKVDKDFPKGRPVIGKGADAYELGKQVPEFYGKRTYSAQLTRALLDQGALSRRTWPDDVSTPEEAEEIWAGRVSEGHYDAISSLSDSLRVMLVFGQKGHVQSLPDLPNVRSAYEGFHDTAGVWVRLNPDKAYVASMSPDRPLPAEENAANTCPRRWDRAAQEWGHTARGGMMARTLTVFASLAEMADRTRAGDWSKDLSAVLHDGPRPQPPEPGRGGRGGGKGKGGETLTLLTGQASASGASSSSSGSGGSALPKPGKGEVFVAFGGNFSGGDCSKTATRGCDLYGAVMDLSTGKVRAAARLAGEAGRGEDFPAVHPDATDVIYQVTGGGPPEIRSLDLATGTITELVDKARLPVLDSTGSTLAYNTEARGGRGQPMRFDVVQHAIDLSGSTATLAKARALTDNGKGTEPILLPDGRVSIYTKGDGPRSGRFGVLDPSTGELEDFGAPSGCAHGSVTPSGSRLFCQQGYKHHSRTLGPDGWGKLQATPFPDPGDPDLSACDQVTFGHPEFCGDDTHLLTTYSCKRGGEIEFARLMLYTWEGEVVSLFSEEVAEVLGASEGQARGGVCTPVR